ncbi:tetratricopeptide repeat protein [Rhizobium rhizogenes]|uniref:tetratricopeptide repeat protein n=1 Tax=Rhizobium rhizogenes TaxID=359 RepID=UPI0022C5EE4F|nr:tetratricopeptide repeat protein [Rhizobium rhizogenes]MCZ7483152.1 tetratricopeptide repeat protein [Rhizobium rhizogenes]
MTGDLKINPIDREEVMAALSQMFASEMFRNSERMQQFLRYIVIETLEGRADRIKSYSIAIEVFGRNSGFDSAEDPIVRTTATRLRSLLDRYNQTANNENGIIIQLPKGRYVPEFQRREERQETRLDDTETGPARTETLNKRKRWPSASFSYAGISLSVVAAVALVITAVLLDFIPWPPFTSVPDHTASVVVIVRDTTATAGSQAAHYLAQDFSELVVGKLVNHGGIKIVDAAGEAADFVSSIVKSRPDDDVFTFDSLVREGGGALSVLWKLNDARSGVVVWATEEPVKNEALRDPNAVADVVIGRLVGLEGAIPTVLSIIYGDHADRRECLTKPQRIAFIYHSAFQQNMRQCLEKVVEKDPADAEAWGVLAQLYHRLGRNAASFGKDTSEFSQLLSDAAQKSVELAPQSFLGMQASMYAAYDKKDFQGFEFVARRILSRFHDPHLKIRIGNAFSNIGRDDEGIPLTREGIEESGELQGLGYLSLGYERYYRGDMLGALEMLSRVNAEDYYLVPLLRAITMAQLSRSEEMNQAVSRLHALRPDYEENLYYDFNHNNVTKPIIDSIAVGLRKAGLQVVDPQAQLN